METPPASPALLEHLFRRQSGRITSCLAGRLGSNNLQLAEDSVQEAMLRALQTWPFQGIPDQPEAWLFRVAHNAAITSLRRSNGFDRGTSDLLLALESAQSGIGDLDVEESLRDDELRMIFMCCHPELGEAMRVALSLKLVSGFSIGEIARIQLAEEATIAQRLVRAKRIIREKDLALRMPHQGELRERIGSVLNVIYLMFSAGYAAASGEALIRSEVCAEALRLGRLIAESRVAASSHGAPRTHALVALMALQSARLPARTDAAGDLVLLEEQDRSLWDDHLIREGFYYFDRSIAGTEESEWHVQAAIAATYAKALRPEEIDWAEILDHYDRLSQMDASPVVALNRAVAIMKVHGPAAALARVAKLEHQPALRGYHLLPAIRGHVLKELGRLEEAAEAYAAALSCDCSEPEKRFLRRQLAAVCGRQACP
jgi:RNA polymerase sigma-70 factor (ECF subfamily)